MNKRWCCNVNNMVTNDRGGNNGKKKAQLGYI